MSPLRPPPPLPIVLGGGLLAALTLPKGVDEDVIPAVVGLAVEAPRGGIFDGDCGPSALGESTVGEELGEVGDSRGLPSLGGSIAAGGCVVYAIERL